VSSSNLRKWPPVLHPRSQVQWFRSKTYLLPPTDFLASLSTNDHNSRSVTFVQVKSAYSYRYPLLMHPLTPLRWMSYMLIALGLINWRYQSAESTGARNSLIIIAIGAFLVALLFLPMTQKIFSHRMVKVISWMVVSGAVLFAILN
ncbi:MAG: hypothetical protein RLZZ17_891, partial [Actinomycetota bacterium]